MVLAPSLRPPGPARPLPDPGPDLAGTFADLPSRFPGPDLAGPILNPDPDAQPRLPGTTPDPDDIIACYTRPRQRRRRRRLLAVAAAVLAAATAWVGLGGWQASPAVPHPPGRAYARHPKAVIQLARARQQRRHQRIAQAAADTAGAGGGGAAARPHPPWRTGTPQPRRGHHNLPGPGRPPRLVASLTELDTPIGALVQALSGPGYKFNSPRAVAADGTHVWVVNGPARGGGSVTELDAATGALVQVLNGPEYRFDQPAAIAAHGTHVWIANEPYAYGRSVTELNAATGALVQVLNRSAYGFDGAGAVASDGARVWVTNSGGDSVTEFPSSRSDPHPQKGWPD